MRTLSIEQTKLVAGGGIVEDECLKDVVSYEAKSKPENPNEVLAGEMIACAMAVKSTRSSPTIEGAIKASLVCAPLFEHGAQMIQSVDWDSVVTQVGQNSSRIKSTSPTLL